jgi:hypothetical protein
MKSDKSEIIIVGILIDSIAEFYEKDKTLMTDGSQSRDGMEQASAFKIGHYFCNEMKGSDLDSYDIDMEYNKNGTDPKSINNKKIKPDLIVHKRGSNNDNLLVVEFKYGLRKNVTEDSKKLKGLTDSAGQYKYKIGVLVELGKDLNCVNYRYFQNGQEVRLP